MQSQPDMICSSKHGIAEIAVCHKWTCRDIHSTFLVEINFFTSVMTISRIIKKCSHNLHDDFRMLISFSHHDTGGCFSIYIGTNFTMLICDHIWFPLRPRICLYCFQQRIIWCPPPAKKGSTTVITYQFSDFSRCPHHIILIQNAGFIPFTKKYQCLPGLFR